MLVCGSCGNQHVVRHIGGDVSLAPLTQDARQIPVSADKRATELSVMSLTKEIAALNQEWQEATSRTDYEWAGYPTLIIALGLMSIIPVLLFLATVLGPTSLASKIAPTIIFFASSTALLAPALHLHIKRIKKIKRLRQTELDRINNALFQKHEQLRHNR